VASYSLELFDEVPDLDVVYVPIGLGSGVCGAIAARNALGLDTEIVGVVSELAPAYALSIEQRRLVEHVVTTQIADGMACRTPETEALQIMWEELSRVVRVTDDEIGHAMRLMYSATHNVAEGAGAAALAAALKDRERLQGKKVGVILSGANVDSTVFAQQLARS
jgi:threonine dehydratase